MKLSESNLSAEALKMMTLGRQTRAQGRLSKNI
jgi:hypothetical protein